MKPERTPSFQFQRDGKVITCWFSDNPQKTNEGKHQYLSFTRECVTELEAIFLLDYLERYQHMIRKEYFTQGFKTHKKKQKNYYL